MKEKGIDLSQFDFDGIKIPTIPINYVVYGNQNDRTQALVKEIREAKDKKTPSKKIERKNRRVNRQSAYRL